MKGNVFIRLLNVLILSWQAANASDVMPLPFKRELSYEPGTPLMTGTDVLIAQTLLNRSPYVVDDIETDGAFGPAR